MSVWDLSHLTALPVPGSLAALEFKKRKRKRKKGTKIECNFNTLKKLTDADC